LKIEFIFKTTRNKLALNIDFRDNGLWKERERERERERGVLIYHIYFLESLTVSKETWETQSLTEIGARMAASKSLFPTHDTGAEDTHAAMFPVSWDLNSCPHAYTAKALTP
jgi:hypothetical protein